MEEELSQWFSGEVKPWEPGVYQRDFSSVENGPKQHVFYGRWDGVSWYASYSSIKVALEEKLYSPHQNLPWRGLACDPAASTAIAAMLKQENIQGVPPHD